MARFYVTRPTRACAKSPHIEFVVAFLGLGESPRLLHVHRHMTGFLLALVLHAAPPPPVIPPVVLAQGRDSRDGGTQRPNAGKKKKQKRKDEGPRGEEE